ncbi:MAG: SoxR reducing system RseC family protein [Candidatus Omnitrophica bacterium]|nr:SoxR reducing system RseC family protein [Candidatus Omnitrophota bacterium]
MFNREVAQIVKIDTNKIKIRFVKKSMCNRCRLNFLSSCGENTLILSCPDKLSLRVGDKIEVGVKEEKFLFASLVLFFLPTLIFIFSLTILRDQHAVISFLGSLFFLGVYYVILKLILKKLKLNLSVKILRKL